MRFAQVSDPQLALWLGLAWLGLAWLGLAWPGLAWPGLAWPGLAWLGLASFGREKPNTSDHSKSMSVEGTSLGAIARKGEDCISPEQGPL